MRWSSCVVYMAPNASMRSAWATRHRYCNRLVVAACMVMAFMTAARSQM